MTTFVLRTASRPIWLCSLLSVLLAPGPSVAGALGPTPRSDATADDTARFYGAWKADFSSNGQTVMILSVHDAGGYHNFVLTPNGNVPADSGAFWAGNGRYRTSAPSPNDSGTYQFVSSFTVVCTNAAGQRATWRRQSQTAQDGATAADPANNPPQPPARFMKK